jgi:hypothetical protein
MAFIQNPLEEPEKSLRDYASPRCESIKVQESDLVLQATRYEIKPRIIEMAATNPFWGVVMDNPYRHCWRKICTLRQAHSKPNKLASHAKRFQDVPVNFSWKLTKDNVVKFQSLELAGWYQTVPYLRPQSQVRWHIATRSYLPAN